MYQGVNKGGGGVVASAADFSGDLEQIPATEAFDSTSGNEGIICQDPDNPNSIIVAQAVLNDVGSLSWIRGDTEKALRRTVSMSQMTSMLRDSERNNVFDAAIKILIDNFLIKVGRAPVALDIGTGTGLLAMLCGRHGAAHVFACEMFDKMAQIAQENVISNDFTEIITIIPCKSSDIENLPIPADIIVSELLDSALLGEAVIPAHSDAIGRLINEELDGIILPISERVIPSRCSYDYT
jgi:protein arginine N-methyltransferase 7